MVGDKGSSFIEGDSSGSSQYYCDLLAMFSSLLDDVNIKFGLASKNSIF